MSTTILHFVGFTLRFMQHIQNLGFYAAITRESRASLPLVADALLHQKKEVKLFDWYRMSSKGRMSRKE